MAESTLMIKIDDDLEKKCEIVLNRFDLNITSAFKMFAQKIVETEDISFILEEEDLDGPYTEEEEALFYSPENMKAVLEGVRQLEGGETVTYTVEELRNLAKELKSQNK